MARDFSRGFYASTAWKRTQAAYMASQCYICERCGRPARVVHHKRYLTPANIGDPSISLDWGNLEALCLECHNQEHMGASPTRGDVRFDASGQVIAR